MAFYCHPLEDAVASAVTAAQDGDMILTLGAGNVSQLGPMILQKLEAKMAGTGVSASVAK